MRKLIACLILCLGVSAATAWADSHEKSTAESADGRSATVAGGQTVILAPSAKTAEEWARERPDYRELKPEIR